MDLWDVTHPRSDSVLGIWLPKNFDLALSWKEFEFQFHECQETEKYELEELVQLSFVLELRHKFRNLTQHEGVYILCTLEFDLQNHHLRLQRFRSAFQINETDTSSQTLKNDFSPVVWSSKDILAICFHLRDHHSSGFAPKNLLLAVSLLSVFAHLLSSFFFLKPSLSIGFSPNSSHQIETAPWILSWSFETRVLRSKHPHWSEWYLCYSFFSEFHELKALMLVNTRCPVSLKCPTISVPMESHFPSGLLVCFPYHILHHLGLGMTSVLARISSHNSRLVRNSKYTFLNFLSLSTRK